MASASALASASATLPSATHSSTSATTLPSADVATLNELMRVLSSPSPFFDTKSPFMGRHHVIAVCGNWYDVVHKASFIQRLANHRPTSTIMLTGGRDERLTPPEAVALGGEPMLLQSELALRNISRARMVLYTGSRITNHNLQAMLMFAQSSYHFDRRLVSLRILEEGFLVRREAAALRALLTLDRTWSEALHSVRIRPVGARTFDELVATHGGRTDVALALMLGEVLRLRQYSNATGEWRGAVTADNALLPAEAARLEPRLNARVDGLLVRHRDGLLASGRALLSDRQRLFASGAAPRSRAAKGDGQGQGASPSGEPRERLGV